MANEPEFSPAVVAAAQRMALDGVAGEVTVAFREAGIALILLKGASFAQWLYDAMPRPYEDVDLLVDPAQWDRAESVVSALGFEGETVTPQGDALWHGSHWRRSDGTIIDLHWTIFGALVPAATTWSVLSERVETLRVGGSHVTALDRPARALHAALHALQHGPAADQPIADLERAIERTSDQDWTSALQLAQRLGATEFLAAGLRLVPSGAEVADRCDLPVATSRLVVLHGLGRRARKGGVAIEGFVAQPGIRRRASYLRRKLAPPGSVVKHRYPVAQRGRLGLVLAYCWRAVRLIPTAVTGVWAWWRARGAIAPVQDAPTRNDP